MAHTIDCTEIFPLFFLKNIPQLMHLTNHHFTRIISKNVYQNLHRHHIPIKGHQKQIRKGIRTLKDDYLPNVTHMSQDARLRGGKMGHRHTDM